MLARLEAHVAEQQRFAANASHELRTPLAITQTLLDVARKDPNRDTGELVDRLHAVNARAIDLTEALLLLSRADQRSFTREPVDLSLVAEEATETLLPLAEKQRRHHRDLRRHRPHHRVARAAAAADDEPRAQRDRPQPARPRHRVGHHQRRPGTVVLTVENTGEQLSPQLVSTLTEPFQRGTERIRTDHAGVGLGLAIVKSIAEAHDGTLTLTPRSGGGLRVTVRLPATGLVEPRGLEPLTPCLQSRCATNCAKAPRVRSGAGGERASGLVDVSVASAQRACSCLLSSSFFLRDGGAGGGQQDQQDLLHESLLVVRGSARWWA